MRLITGLTIASLSTTLIFDGTNFILTEVDGLASPTVRLPRYNLPGASGAFISNALYGERSLKIKGYVNAPDGKRNTYLTNRLSLINATAIQSTSAGVLTPQTLTFTFEDGQTLTTTGYIDTPLQLKFSEQQPDYEEFLFTMVCTDPNLYSLNQITGTVNLPVGGGTAIPTAIPASLAPSSGGSLVLNNTGAVASYPIITLSSPLTNPYITNMTTNTFLKINYTLNTGDASLVINCATQTITQGTNTVTGITSYDSTFWSLFPGNNTIGFSASSGTGTATIAFYPAYIGK